SGCGFGILILALLLPAAWSPRLARSVTIASDMAEQVGEAARRAMHAGANASSSAAQIFSAITDNTLIFAETVWEGIDLTSVTVKSSAGRLFFDGSDDLLEAILAPKAQGLMALPSHWRHSLARVLELSSPTRPLVEVHWDHFCSRGRFTALELWMKHFDVGHVDLAWRSAEASFTAYWNLFSDISPEYLKIDAMLQEALEATIPQPDLSLSKGALGHAPVLVAPSFVIRAWRWVCRLASWATGPQDGGVGPRLSTPTSDDTVAEGITAPLNAGPHDGDNSTESPGLNITPTASGGQDTSLNVQ
ncbi:unnamed protein product, partial [Prorocentrum cordatum]